MHMVIPSAIHLNSPEIYITGTHTHTIFTISTSFVVPSPTKTDGFFILELSHLSFFFSSLFSPAFVLHLSIQKPNQYKLQFSPKPGLSHPGWQYTLINQAPSHGADRQREGASNQKMGLRQQPGGKTYCIHYLITQQEKDRGKTSHSLLWISADMLNLGAEIKVLKNAIFCSVVSSMSKCIVFQECEQTYFRIEGLVFRGYLGGAVQEMREIRECRMKCENIKQTKKQPVNIEQKQMFMLAQLYICLVSVFISIQTVTLTALNIDYFKYP